MPTSPVTPPQSPHENAVLDQGERLIPAPGLIAEWARVSAFLTRPFLPRNTAIERPFVIIARIFLLDLSAMVLLVGAALIAMAAGAYLPETALAGVEFTPVVILSVVIGAPVLEELVFRGWLSGKPGTLLALGLIAAGVAGFGFIHTASPIAGMPIVLASLIGAIAVLVMLRRRPALRWFAAGFPIFFWLSTLAFALVHLANFDEGSVALLLPLVLPQFVLGMMLGYLRVQIGLWAAILLHAVHNGIFIGIAALAQSMS